MNTMQNVTTNAGFRFESRKGFITLLADFVSRFRAYRQHQRDYRHLMELPDYLLKDVGLSHGQIVEIRRRHPLENYKV